VVADHLEAKAVDIEIDADEHAAKGIGNIVEDVEEENNPGMLRQAVRRGHVVELRAKT
jgi:hypothetical protein